MISFETGEAAAPVELVRTSEASKAYLARLRAEYALDQVVAGQQTDYDRVRAVSKWVRSRWKHNGSNEPQRNDPISILEEAQGGKRFRCVEYAIVLAAALEALDIPARVVTLKTEDADTRRSGAGHVVAEAYLKDLQKWIMVDGQWDVIPVLGGKPLNAVELQQAIASRAAGLGVVSHSGSGARGYLKWIAPYLFYFGTAVDSRYAEKRDPRELVLYPIGAKELPVFQQRFSMANKVWTHSLPAFYGPPQ